LVTGSWFFPTTTSFGGKTIANGGSEDMLVAKLDPTTGNANWVFTAGDSNDQAANSVAPTSGNLAVVGNFTGTLDIDPINGVIPPIVNTGTTPIDFIVGLSREKGITVFFSSPLLDQVQRISDRVGIMLKGNLVAVGPIQELAKQKLGVDQERFTLEEIYMRYFREGVPAQS